ncbi:hypothetical protein [Tardiphaga robiniae]|uniref:hypothetical protein n=1 Tax=Tardiphaga robiniae TaxID=943830 RepID=UPI0015867DD5|nr:hypothetical protein [Tardiphaga robiniae]NUU41861.1 hypothetical protein [Tardiphaga robiniae]
MRFSKAKAVLDHDFSLHTPRQLDKELWLEDIPARSASLTCRAGDELLDYTQKVIRLAYVSHRLKNISVNVLELDGGLTIIPLS